MKVDRLSHAHSKVPFVILSLPYTFCFIYWRMYISNVEWRTENIQGVPIATETGNEEIAKKFEQDYVRCVRNEEECVCSVCL